MLPLPLAGIRVLDFCVAWAGPFATQLLADLGAEVIKVENTHIWQTATRGQVARPSREMIEALAPMWAGYPNMDPGPDPWNRCPMGVNHFRNKLSMTCDTRTAKGREIVGRLAALSDVLYENNPTEVMEKLGITYEWLTSLRPDIIYVRAPAFGSTGARRDARGAGTTVEAFVGHTLLRGYPDLGPTTLAEIYPSDAFGGLIGAFSVIAALEFRRRTGKGQLVEVPQAEAAVALFPQAVMDFSLNGRIQGTTGNRDPHGAAPSGVYPCRGEDRWIALTVTTDAEWAALCRVMRRADLVLDPRFVSPADRHRNHDALDELLSSMTSGHDATALMGELQREGVAAGLVMDPRDCYRDPQLAERRYFEVVHDPHTGTYPWPGMPFQLSATPLHIRKPPCGLGEDNEYVYRTLLGISDEEYADLEREGHIGTEFAPEIP